MADDSFKSKLYDPNGELSEDELRTAQIAGDRAFHSCRIQTKQFIYKGCKTLVYGEMGSQKHLVYARVTHSENEEDGTGSMPQVLLDAANEIGAEPHVVRVYEETGGWLKFWGVDELEKTLKSNTKEWRSILLKGKTVSEFARLVKGKISRLELIVEYILDDNPVSPEEALLRQLFNEPVESAKKDQPILAIRLTVDGKAVSRTTIGLSALAASCHGDGEHFIFTCSCGTPGCAEVNRGVVVATEDGLTVWKAYSMNPKRVFVFDHKQYQAEILEKLKVFCECYKKLPDPQKQDDNSDTYWMRDLETLQKAIYEVEQARISDVG